MGIEGVALSTLINQTIIVTWAWWKMKKINYFRGFYKLTKIVFTVGLMAAATVFMQNFGVNIWLNVAASAGVYFGTLYALREPALHKLIHLRE